MNEVPSWINSTNDLDITDTINPCYIVCLTSSLGRLYAVGIETAEQVWQRCKCQMELIPDFNHNITPVIIAPVILPSPMHRWTSTNLDWNIPLLKGS